MRFLATTVVWLAIAMVAGTAFIYSGWFNPAADEAHSRLVYWALDNLRQRGVDARAAGILSPGLDSPALVSSGAGNYDAMCATCHLKPGVTDSELHRGLYPQPPALAMASPPTEPARAFWIIKHGIKSSGMPAWGKSMDDQAIWGLVAFLQALPALTPESYREAVEHSQGHSHGSGHAGAATNAMGDSDEAHRSQAHDAESPQPDSPDPHQGKDHHHDDPH